MRIRLFEHRSIPSPLGDRCLFGVAFEQQVPQRPQHACLGPEGAVDSLQRNTGVERDVVDGRADIPVALEQPLRGLEDGESSHLGLLPPALRVVGAFGGREISHLTTLQRYSILVHYTQLRNEMT